MLDILISASAASLVILTGVLWTFAGLRWLAIVSRPASRGVKREGVTHDT